MMSCDVIIHKMTSYLQSLHSRRGAGCPGNRRDLPMVSRAAVRICTRVCSVALCMCAQVAGFTTATDHTHSVQFSTFLAVLLWQSPSECTAGRTLWSISGRLQGRAPPSLHTLSHSHTFTPSSPAVSSSLRCSPLHVSGFPRTLSPPPSPLPPPHILTKSTWALLTP